jgi:hypothetical protein
MGCAAQPSNKARRGSVIQTLNALLLITKWYNIGKKELAFYVNIANICTDIILKKLRKLYLCERGRQGED